MSCQTGNASRTRSQKYQNQFSFKNDMHDKSHKRKLINNIDVANVCERCKKILEWKIKYKKYKLLKAPAKCTKCDEKTVKHAYHIMCLECAKARAVCPKCNEKTPIVETKTLLKSLPERKESTFTGHINSKSEYNNKSTNAKDNEGPDEDNGKKENFCNEEHDTPECITRETLREKLKSLKIKEQDSNFDSDPNDDDLDDFL